MDQGTMPGAGSGVNHDFSNNQPPGGLPPFLSGEGVAAPGAENAFIADDALPTLEEMMGDPPADVRKAAYHLTLFPDQFAQERGLWTATIEDIAVSIRNTTAEHKAHLPFLKFALFGDTRSPVGKSYRHNANVYAITGIEGDCDGGPITFEQAVDRLRAAGICAVVYTTPSNTDDEPHWRALCPSSAWLEPGVRTGLVDRLNGIFGGGLAGESWTLSQSYYFGNVTGRPPVRVAVVAGDYIDLRPDLVPIPKPGGTRATTRDHPDAEAVSGEPIIVETLEAMGEYVAEFCADMHYPELIVAVLGALRMNVIGDDDGSVREEVARKIWGENTASESLTDAKFEDLLRAPPAYSDDGRLIGPGTFAYYARGGGWCELAPDIWADVVEKELQKLRDEANSFDWTRPLKDGHRAFADKTVFDKLQQPEAGDTLIKQCCDRGYTPEQVFDLFARYAALPGAKHYPDEAALRAAIRRIFTRNEPYEHPQAEVFGGGPDVNGPARRGIKVIGNYLPTAVDDAEMALIEQGAGLYQRGDTIVRPGDSRIAVRNGGEVMGERLFEVKVGEMREHMTRCADFLRYAKTEGTWSKANCPEEVARTYLDRKGRWNIRPLDSIVNAPVLRRDGSILQQPGYDPETALIYNPGATVFPEIGGTREAALAALAALKNELLCGFPFVTGADRAVALSAIVTAVTRRTLKTAPLHAVTAPRRGTGKGKLLDLAAIIATGRQASAIVQGRNERRPKSVWARCCCRAIRCSLSTTLPCRSAATSCARCSHVRLRARVSSAGPKPRRYRATSC